MNAGGGGGGGYLFTSEFGGIRPDVRKCWNIWCRNDDDLLFGYGGHFENTSGAFVAESLIIIDEAPITTVNIICKKMKKILNKSSCLFLRIFLHFILKQKNFSKKFALFWTFQSNHFCLFHIFHGANMEANLFIKRTRWKKSIHINISIETKKRLRFVLYCYTCTAITKRRSFTVSKKLILKSHF